MWLSVVVDLLSRQPSRMPPKRRIAQEAQKGRRGHGLRHVEVPVAERKREW